MNTDAGDSIRVVIIDDDALVRTALAMILRDDAAIELAGEADDGQTGLDLIARVAPDVVLMDIRMPTMDGIEATRAIASTPGLQDVRVLILTTYDTDSYVFEGLQAGASGFLLKDAGPAELLHGIRVVAAGAALLAPRVTRRLIAQFATRRAANGTAEERLAVLTGREREILALVGQGLNNDEIGAKLFLSPATARTHVSRILVKLGARDRTQLVVMAYEWGLVRPGWQD